MVLIAKRVINPTPRKRKHCYEQKRNKICRVNNVDHAIKHAIEKNAEIALIYDRYYKMHRDDIERGMQKYKQLQPQKYGHIKAVLVVDKNKNLYEHHFD